jgi:membrane protein
VRLVADSGGVIGAAVGGLLLCAEANVVATDHLYPRALLTPFTDHVELTRGDRKTYAGQAEAQRAKGFERIDVTFDERDSKDAQA